MSTLVKSIELDGIIDINHNLILETKILPVDGPRKVKVVISMEIQKKQKSKTVYGLFKKYAKEKLIKEEKSAWKNAMIRKHVSS